MASAVLAGVVDRGNSRLAAPAPRFYPQVEPLGLVTVERILPEIEVSLRGEEELGKNYGKDRPVAVVEDASMAYALDGGTMDHQNLGGAAAPMDYQLQGDGCGESPMDYQLQGDGGPASSMDHHSIEGGGGAASSMDHHSLEGGGGAASSMDHQSLEEGGGAAVAARLDTVEEQSRVDERLLLETSLPRNLSSPDKAVRNRALEALRNWLSSCKVVEESCLVGIWQSIFYRIWSTSKVTEQGELIRNVATIVGSLKPEVAILAFKVLLSTMIREWNGIEKKKLEKFRLLLQVCLGEMFKVLESHGWSEELNRKFAEAFQERSLMESQAQAVNLFLVQAFVEELRCRIPPSPEVLRILLEPFVTMFATSTDKAVLQKVRDTVFLQLLQEARKVVKMEKRGDEKSLGSLILDLPLARKFFELSAEPSLGPINKKFLQQLYEDFSKSEAGVSPRILKRVASPTKLVVDELAEPPPEFSVTGRKRKRITGEAVLFQPRRVLRSELKLSDSEAEESPLSPRRRSPRRSPSRSPSPSPSLSPRRSPRRRGGIEDHPQHSSEKDTVSGDEDQSCCSGGGGGKKVRFSLENNIVWSPQRPLPPAWVRVPPYAAPRGSAMKPGVLPGPITDPAPTKRRKVRRKKKMAAEGAAGTASSSSSSSKKKAKMKAKRSRRA